MHALRLRSFFKQTTGDQRDSPCGELKAAALRKKGKAPATSKTLTKQRILEAFTIIASFWEKAGRQGRRQESLTGEDSLDKC